MKKIIGYIVILLLFAGTIAGIYYCVQYYTRDLSYYEQKLEQLEEENSAYKEDIAEYLAKIEEDKNTINSLNEQILQYQEQNTTNQETISALESSKQQLETQVENLTESNNSNLAIIAENETTISNLQAQVEQLQSTVGDNTEQIEQLNNTILSLQNINSQLQQSNEDNLTTISSLNSQIESLNEQISDLIEQSQNNSSIVNSLNAQIAQLQQTIEYYEEFLKQFETGDKVIVTFEFNGSVYDVQILDKNSKVTVDDPTSTDYVQFNYWTVDGEQVDLSTYTITQSTTFVANVTHKYDVKFMVDDQVHDSQIVTENAFATLPENPTKEGYEFDGWSINGIDIVSNITTTQVNSNVIYKAVFTQLHTVTFMSDGEIKSTQSVRNGECATNVDIESTTYKVFNGWKIDNDIINISEYPIYSSVVFIADYINKYDVKFMVDGQVYDSQIVEENGYATLPETPTKEGYIFEGWFLAGFVEIDIPEWEITQNITLTAKFTKLHTVDFVVNNVVVDTQSVKDGEKAITPQINIPEGFELVGWSDGSNIIDLTSYNIVEDITLTAKLSSDTFNAVVSKTWNNYSNINGEHVWTDGENIYYSSGSANQYKLNKNTNTWESVSWTFDSTEENLFIVGNNVWTDGEDVYYSNYNRQFVLNKETMIWEKAPWGSYIYGNCVWSDGENIYYTTNAMEGESLIFNRATKSWSSVEFKIDNSNLTTIDVLGSEVWTDGENIYYSYGAGYQLKLDKSTRTWTYFDFNVVIAYGRNIWTYDNDIYYSFGATQYKLDKNNNKFVEIVWEGADSLRGDYIWTDGDQVYCSNSSTYQYQLINA